MQQQGSERKYRSSAVHVAHRYRGIAHAMQANLGVASASERAGKMTRHAPRGTVGVGNGKMFSFQAVTTTMGCRATQTSQQHTRFGEFVCFTLDCNVEVTNPSLLSTCPSTTQPKSNQTLVKNVVAAAVQDRPARKHRHERHSLPPASHYQPVSAACEHTCRTSNMPSHAAASHTATTERNAHRRVVKPRTLQQKRG